MVNRDSLRGAAPAVIMVWVWLGLCSPALALTGAAVAPAGILDSLPPAVTLNHPLGGELIAAGAVDTLRWTVAEDLFPAGEPISVTLLDVDSVIWTETVIPMEGGAYSLPWTAPVAAVDSARFAVAAIDSFGWSGADTSSFFSVIDGPTGVDGPPIPMTGIVSVHPNPFNPRAVITFALASAAPVELTVYDLTGRRVARLVNRILDSGNHSLVWDGRDSSGRQAASGTYLARLHVAGAAGQSVSVARMTLLK